MRVVPCARCTARAPAIASSAASTWISAAAVGVQVDEAGHQPVAAGVDHLIGIRMLAVPVAAIVPPSNCTQNESTSPAASSLRALWMTRVTPQAYRAVRALDRAPPSHDERGAGEQEEQRPERHQRARTHHRSPGAAGRLDRAHVDAPWSTRGNRRRAGRSPAAARTPGLPALNTGLPASGRCVRVGPPLSASGPQQRVDADLVAGLGLQRREHAAFRNANVVVRRDQVGRGPAVGSRGRRIRCSTRSSSSA